MKKISILYFVFITIQFVVFTAGQTALAQSSSNLSTINVDDLSDAQVKELVQKAQASGQSDTEILQAAKARGMSDVQVQRLQARITAIRSSNNNADADTSRQLPRHINYRPDSTRNANHLFDDLGPKVFGADLFSGSSLTFEPNLRLATPLNYILGPDDQLSINVYGYSVDNWKLTISPEGNINMPHVGIVNVGGKTIEQATAIIKTKLAANNYAIGRGTSVSVSLGDIRSIKVTITGEVVKPGTYTLPSLATVFNALYTSGGPNQNGSFRNIEIIRNNRIVRRLDIYDFLLKGDQKDNIGLRDQDIIRVPTYRVRVEMAGEVKRPALYEVLPGETLQDVINFSGGFTDVAYTAKIQVLQINDNERSIKDETEDDFKNYTPLRGDKYIVTRILERFTNRVSINGAVIRPGNYALEKNLTLSKLITKASGLREDAYMQLATITRVKPDNTIESISFNVQDILNHTAADIPLQREDIVTISSIFDLHDRYTVSVVGEVRNPGDFAYADNLTVENLIVRAGGLAEGASPKRIQVLRRVDNSDPTALNGNTAQVFSVDVNRQLGLNATNFTLKPFDVVSVYTSPGFEKQRLVKVEGEVLFPGFYAIKTKNERISDLVKEAGGLTPSAYVDGATLKRVENTGLDITKGHIDTAALLREKESRINKAARAVSDSVALSQDSKFESNYVGIDLKKIMDKPGSRIDVILEDGDLLRVPKQIQTVKVNGEVLMPVSVIYKPSETFKGYVLNAGGFSDEALRGKSYIMYPNGTIKGTSKFLFFNIYPRVKPGSEIYVPKKKPHRGLTTQEAIGITSGLASIALIIVTLINQSK